jgi:hypothetical protein
VVEAGSWQGHPVDVAMMDRLAAAGNEMTLRRFAERLPRADLRQEARRCIVRIHIELSALTRCARPRTPLRTPSSGTGTTASCSARTLSRPVTLCGATQALDPPPAST